MVKLVNIGYKSCSSWGVVKHGVPQHSILGRLLFLLYINTMKITNTKDKNNKSKLVLFADDTHLIITSPNPTNL